MESAKRRRSAASPGLAGRQTKRKGPPASPGSSGGSLLVTKDETYTLGSAIGEGTEVKSTGQRQAEELLGEMGLPWSCFRPQYIYGPAQGKTYLKYFFDRVTRGRPVPVPNGGDQMVTMTHAADNAAMIAAAVGNPKAAGEVFNCATSLLISYDELAALCAKAAGAAPPKIVHYDPKALPDGITKKNGFPFRETPFFVSVDKAASTLGFQPKNDLKDDIAWYYTQNYKQGDEPDWGALEDARAVARKHGYEHRSKHFFNNKNECTLMLRLADESGGG